MSRFAGYDIIQHTSQTLAYLYLLFYGICIVAVVMTNLKVFLTQRQFSYVSSLFYVDPTSKFYFFLSSISLLGIPPLSGFVIKFSFVILVLLKNNLVILFLFFIYTIVGIYLYLRLVKLGIPKKPSTIVLKSLLTTKKTLDFLEAYILTFFSFLNIMFFLFFKDFFLILL